MNAEHNTSNNSLSSFLPQSCLTHLSVLTSCHIVAATFTHSLKKMPLWNFWQQDFCCVTYQMPCPNFLMKISCFFTFIRLRKVYIYFHEVSSSSNRGTECLSNKSNIHFGFCQFIVFLLEFILPIKPKFFLNVLQCFNILHISSM